jgi:ABC-type antimicrobial peptide transport system permease subunit
MVSGLAMAAVGLLWFAQLGPDSSYVSSVLLPEILISFGMGVSFVPMSSTALFGVDPGHAGVASALVNTTQQVGGALGTALLNTVAAAAVANYLAAHAGQAGLARAAVVHGYTTAFTVSAVLVAAAAVIAGVLVRAPRDQLPSGLPHAQESGLGVG